jgi:uncharacterized protein YhhL (DUF1145 family)
MKYIGILLLISLLLLLPITPIVNAQGTSVTADQDVTISLTGKGLQVDESIKMTNTGAENVTSLRFWVQQNAQDTTIIERQSGRELIPLITGNIRTCNLSAANLTIPTGESLTVTVTYFLPTTEQYFLQTLMYDTDSLSVVYKDGTTELTLFQGEHLVYRADVTNSLQIRLYKPTEAPLNISILIIVFLIVLIVLASLLLLLRKQRTKKTKAAESEETLSTKKALLLSLLKDLEKQYRAHSISDETYTKLKEEYKADAVDAMKKLDDLKK